MDIGGQYKWRLNNKNPVLKNRFNFYISIIDIYQNMIYYLSYELENKNNKQSC